MCGKKAIASLIVSLGLVGLLSIGLFFIYFSAISEENKSLSDVLYSRLVKYDEVIKGFSKNALIISTSKASSLIGSKADTYVCNKPTPPSVGEVKYELTNETQRILNTFIENYSLEQAFNISIKNFDCVEYLVNETSVSSGQADEKFAVFSFGSNIYLSILNSSVNSTNDVLEQMLRNRFWYMYRNFVDWSRQTQIVQEIEERCIKESMNNCDFSDTATSCESCGVLTDCIDSVIASEARNLELQFADRYVECTGKRNCCVAESVKCLESKPEDWVQPSCTKCDLDRRSDSCFALQSFGMPNLGYVVSFLSGVGDASENNDLCAYKCEDWKTNKLAVELTMSCTDKKYELSLAKGERYLTFAVDVDVFRQAEGNHYDVCAETTKGHCKCESVCCPECDVATHLKNKMGKNCECGITSDCCEGFDCSSGGAGGGGGGGGDGNPPPVISPTPTSSPSPAPPSPTPTPAVTVGPPPPPPTPPAPPPT